MTGETKSGIWIPEPMPEPLPEVNPSMETEERLREIAAGIAPAGYWTKLCDCAEGAYLGARLSGTPCCCERCGMMTVEYFDALVASVYEHLDLE